MTLDDIVDLARRYAAAHRATQEVVDDILDKQRRALQSRLRALKSRAGEMGEARGRLVGAIEAHPELFAAPRRTQEIDHIRFGLRKRQGDIDHGPEKDLVNAIYLQLPEALVRMLIQKKVTVSKTALRKLDADQLRRIGVSIGEAGDEVTISAGGGQLDRLVAGMLAAEDRPAA